MFKAKHSDNSGIKIPQTNKHIKWTDRHIQIPKLGKVKWVYHRRIKGRVLSITIKRDVDHWYVSVLADQGKINQNTSFNENDCIGIDSGLKDFAITSDGEVFETPKFFRKKQKKLARIQRIHSRRKKQSKNRDKQRIKLAKLHRKIRFQRSDLHHKISYVITKHNKVVFVEDLNVRGMIKNHKLAKAIQDQGWSQFNNYMKYKLDWKGDLLYKINRWAPSTKTCSCCGSIKSMTLDQRVYVCSECGHVMDRDLNAAINIKTFGINEINRAGTVQIHACGATTNGGASSDVSSYVASENGEAGINSLVGGILSLASSGSPRIG